MSSSGVITEAIAASGLQSGETISFHHHLRNGDGVMQASLSACAALGLRDLHLAPSSLFPCHANLVPFLENGTVTRITTAYMNGPLADFVSRGGLAQPVRLTTHGGRARLIESGEMPVDLAVIAAPAVDEAGNLSGADGPAACGPLGYAMPDAARARSVLALAQTRVSSVSRVCIPAEQVDQTCLIPAIGDARLIESGTTARPVSAEGRAIADLAVQALAAAGALRGGLRYQAGAGGVSLEVTRRLAARMAEQGIVGDFAAGGVTRTLVEMMRAGLFRRLWDVQSFDLAAVRSYAEDPGHRAMSAALYANPDRPDCIAHQLDVMILSAAEVDCDFNVNVTTTGQGRIIGGSGGHGDTAEGAGLSVVVVPSQSKGHARIVERVRCITTPGASIDLVVTERGVAVNPQRPDLAADLGKAGLPVVGIESLKGARSDVQMSQRCVAICEDRHAKELDRLYAVQREGQ